MTRAAKSPPVPGDLLSAHWKFAAGYSECEPGRNEKRKNKVCGNPGKSREIPGQPGKSLDVPRIPTPSLSSSSSSSSSLKELASQHDAGWPACWCDVDPEQKIPKDIRQAFEGTGAPATPEACAEVMEVVAIDQNIARAKLHEMLTAATPKTRPSSWLLKAVKAAAKEKHQAETAAKAKTEREAAERGRRAAPSAPVDPAAIHRILWHDGRPKNWEICACSECVKGRAGRAGASGGSGVLELVQGDVRPTVAPGLAVAAHEEEMGAS